MQQDKLKSGNSMEHCRIFRDNALFNALTARRLTWWPEVGIGYYPVEAGKTPYDVNYWVKYQSMARTDIGRKLNSARVQLVARHYDGTLVDVGIGSGAFMEARDAHLGSGAEDAPTLGYDVNPFAISHLKARKRWWDINRPIGLPAVSFWDTLEHIPEFENILRKVNYWVFMSLPIFDGPQHILRSKHYRKDEHVWYFSLAGIRWMMNELGFDCVEISHAEVEAGREDIGAFAFKRRQL